MFHTRLDQEAKLTSDVSLCGLEVMFVFTFAEVFWLGNLK